MRRSVLLALVLLLAGRAAAGAEIRVLDTTSGSSARSSAGA
jgi:hypothetical protein